MAEDKLKNVQKVSRNEGGERKALEKETKLKGISSVG
jgi:hypothetical protein